MRGALAEWRPRSKHQSARNHEWNEVSSLLCLSFFPSRLFFHLQANNTRQIHSQHLNTVYINGLWQSFILSARRPWLFLHYHSALAATFITIIYNQLWPFCGNSRWKCRYLQVFLQLQQATSKTSKTLQIRISFQYSVLKVAECLEIYI